ncbi:hypothetical protein LCGC14_0538160 [marine sediment metagenome]|uniref:Uncharacterized protein n=1 Tax=marine sediment metagenome TaxID=412755 RepID=A0A0F9V1U2_9ZZZZ|nr:hypothetical protein [bacterium]
MNKYQEWKTAVKAPPPERLAKVEYQSHFFQMMGISFVCIILLFKGFWYIIFAFIFGLGISYSQGMSAYIKYNNIMALIKPEAVEDYDKDNSPTRRRSKIINHVFGSTAKWISIFISAAVPLFFIQFAESRIAFSFAYVMMMIVIFTLVYFFFFYWVANHFYQHEVKVE